MPANGTPRWLFATLALALATGCVSVSKSPQLYTGKRQIRYTQEAEVFTVKTNGLTVLLLPEAHTNLVMVNVRYQVGAAEDPPGKSGLAHLIEHVLFQVQPGGPEAPTLRQRLGATALDHNAYTTWDATQYMSMGMARDLDGLLEIESQRMRATCDQIDDALLQRELDIVRNEANERASPDRALRLALHARIYGEDHPYARPVGGHLSDLERITRQDVCDFLENHYSTRSAILVVSGSISVDATLPLLERHFGRIRARGEAARLPMAAPVLTGTTSQHAYEGEGTEAMAFISFAFPPALSGDALMQEVLLRLWRDSLYELQRETSYIHRISLWGAGGERAPLAGLLVTVNEPGKLPAAVERIFAARKFLGEEVTEKALHTVRSDLYAEKLFTSEPFEERSELFTDYLHYAEHDGFLLRDLQTLDRLGVEAVENAERSLLRPEHSHVAYIYPRERSDEPGEGGGRIALDGQGPSYHIPEWQVVVDPREAEVTLPVDDRGVSTQVTERVLPNGLRVLMAPSLTYPVMDIRMIYPVGTRHDPADRPGLATTAAELLDWADKVPHELRTTQDIAQIQNLLLMGGSLDRHVDQRTTTFHMTGLSVHADALLWKLYFFLNAGEYKSSALERLHRSLAESDTEESRRDEQRMRIIAAATFGKDHPFVVSRATRSALARISLRDLSSFRARHYGARGATLIVTGGFDQALVNAEIDRLFGSLRGEEAPLSRTVPAATSQAPVHFALHTSDSAQVVVRVAYAIEARFEQQHAARLVLREMVQDALQPLRESLGATYHIEVSQSTGDGPGELVITTRIDRRRAAESFLAMRRALHELQAGDLSEAFVRARRRVLRRMLAGSAHSGAVAGELSLIVRYGVAPSYRDTLARQVAALRPADIRALIAAELAPGREIVVVGGPASTVDAVYQAAGIRNIRVLK